MLCAKAPNFKGIVSQDLDCPEWVVTERSQELRIAVLMPFHVLISKNKFYRFLIRQLLYG
jgi:hypothetical protein